MRSGLCLVLVWLAATSSVEAQCACTCEDMPVLQIGPSPPSNLRALLRIPVFSAERPEVMLTNEAGNPVDLALEAAGDAAGRAFWLSPRAPLPPGAYTLVVRGFSLSQRAEFVVATDATDATRPSLTRLETGTPVSWHCGDLNGVFLEWAAGAALDEALALEVEVWRGGELLGVVFPTTYPRGGPAALGTSPNAFCYRAALIDGVMEGDELMLRARLWDGAGNVSDVRTLTVIAQHFPAAESCARWCSASLVPSRGLRPAIAVASLAVLCALVLRRTRSAAMARG